MYVPLLESTLTIVDGKQTDMKLEYAKSKARVERWQEEAILVAEEMRRTVEFLRWKANRWLQTADEHRSSDSLHKGFDAYANRQANQFMMLSSKFCARWKDILSVNGLDTSWI